jgi:tRNA A37 threonylcarbamoyladenosine biosynthesis protein TsaE
MTDYNELYKQLAQEVVAVEGNIGTDTAAFVQQFVDTLPAGKQDITSEAKAQ